MDRKTISGRARDPLGELKCYPDPGSGSEGGRKEGDGKIYQNITAIDLIFRSK